MEMRTNSYESLHARQQESTKRGIDHVRSVFARMDASSSSVRPLWIQRVVSHLRASEGEAAVLIERCTETRCFVSNTVNQDLDLDYDLEPVSSVLLVPSAPLLAVSDTNTTALVLALLWDHDSAWFVSMAQQGYEGLAALERSVTMIDDTGVQLHVVEAQGNLKSFIKALASTPWTALRPSTPGERYRARKASVLPVPFYVVKPRLHSSAPTDGMRAGPVGAGLDFRFERRSHLRLLLERSDEPLEAREGWQLIGPRDEPGPKLARHLEARGHLAKQPGEWLLVRISTVQAHLVGPEDAPVIPSVKLSAPGADIGVQLKHNDETYALPLKESP